MIKTIDHIEIAVKDVDRVSQLFQKMGFEFLRRTTHGGGKGAVELKLPGPNQILFEIHPLWPKFQEGKPGVRHVSFTVDNVQETFDDFKAKGIKSPQEKPGLIPQTGRTIFTYGDDDLGAFTLHFQEEERKPFVTPS